jgi:hypothetical protein
MIMIDYKKYLTNKFPENKKIVFLGKVTTGTAVTRYHAESGRIKTLYFTITNSNKARQTRESKVRNIS